MNCWGPAFYVGVCRGAYSGRGAPPTGEVGAFVEGPPPELNACAYSGRGVPPTGEVGAFVGGPPPG
jgi:hypothetical protein